MKYVYCTECINIKYVLNCIEKDKKIAMIVLV